jgi:hypothetical protein
MSSVKNAYLDWVVVGKQQAFRHGRGVFAKYRTEMRIIASPKSSHRF